MKILYEFEHKLLPKWAYNSVDFFNDLVNKGIKETLYRAIKSVYDNHKEECPYREDDFSGFSTRLDVDTFVIVLRLPKPEEVPMCYCALLYMDLNTKRIAYYTMEKGKDPIDEREIQFLCGWDKEGNHNNYGSAYTDKYNFGDVMLVRFFYNVFWGLKTVKLPEQLKQDNGSSTTMQCPACKKEIIIDNSGINEGDEFLLFCSYCGRIYRLKLQDNDYLIKNKIKE